MRTQNNYCVWKIQGTCSAHHFRPCNTPPLPKQGNLSLYRYNSCPMPGYEAGHNGHGSFPSGNRRKSRCATGSKQSRDARSSTLRHGSRHRLRFSCHHKRWKPTTGAIGRGCFSCVFLWFANVTIILKGAILSIRIHIYTKVYSQTLHPIHHTSYCHPDDRREEGSR